MRKLTFTLVLLILFLLIYVIGYWSGQPKTFRVTELENLIDAGQQTGGEWLLHDPSRYRFGNYFVMFPKNTDQDTGSMAVFTAGGFPFLLAQDLDGNGFPDELIITDAKGRSVAVIMSDDELDVFESSFSIVSGTPNLDAVTYIDEDFDGQPDVVHSDQEGSSRIR